MLTIRINKEQKLLKKCASGDRKAQLELYTKYAQSMFKVSLSIVRKPSLAEDAIQEAFISAYRNLDSFKGEVTFGAWMKKIVVNKSITLLKKENRYDFSTSAQKLYEFDQEVEFNTQNTDLKTLRQSMNQLSDKYHTMISLYYLEGYDHHEISDILNINYDNSRTLLSRAKMKLKTLIENERSI